MGATYIVSGVEYADESKAIAALSGQHGSGLVDVEWLDVAGSDDANRVFIAKPEAVLWLRYLRNHGRSAYDITQAKEATMSEPKVYFDKDGNERIMTAPNTARLLVDVGELFRENPRLQQARTPEPVQDAKPQPAATPAPHADEHKATLGGDTKPTVIKPHEQGQRVGNPPPPAKVSGSAPAAADATPASAPSHKSDKGKGTGDVL
jgi:hypothetical protein